MMTRIDSAWVIVTTHRQDKVLLVQNKKDNGWSLPGGKREPGETLWQAAQRELLEETGLSQPIERLCAINETIGVTVHDLYATFLVTVDDAQPVIPTGDKSIMNVAWFSVDDADKKMPYYPGGIRHLLTGKAVYF